MKRLALRGDHESPWILDRIDNCIESLQAPCFSSHIKTDNKVISEVVEEIISSIKQA